MMAYGWYMPVMAEAVPGLVHVSLFLLFEGFGDFTLGTNTTESIPLSPSLSADLSTSYYYHPGHIPAIAVS